MKRISNFLEWNLKDRYYYLFVFLALFIFLPPFIVQFEFLGYSIHLLLSLIILNCVLILFDKSKKSGYGVLIAIVALGFFWLSVTEDWQNTTLQVVRILVIVIFFGLTFVKMVSEIFKMKEVTGRVVIGAIGAYLLLGIIGALIFEMVELGYPNSYTNMENFTGFYSGIYLSFVTISTLGYGDITPLTPQGQAVAIMVSISGQLYLAILMAMLVGKFLQNKEE
jgi:voltage-gated potassium channel